MSTFKNGLLGAAITALTITVGLVAFTGASHATTFGQTSDDSTNQKVGTNAANNVTVTDLGTGYLDITVNLATNWGLVNTGAGGNGGSFVFGLSGISSLTFTPIVPTTFEDPAPGTWYPTGSTVATASSNPVTVSSASFSAPGKFLY